MAANLTKGLSRCHLSDSFYRLVNITLINEFALLTCEMCITIWEVIEAAKTKSYGFQAFYTRPGRRRPSHPPLDPFYLEYIAKAYNFDLTITNTASNINSFKPTG
jgi:UDP-N-acetyl-D-glucosamine dehydrogenase